jgi:PAS domain S-box-containing protein
MKTSVKGKIVLGCVASLLALASMGWFSYVTTADLVATESWVSHTHEVIGTLESGLAILTDAETQQRGYLLTGDDRFFQDSKSSQAQIGAWMRKIRQLTADNPQEQQRLNQLMPLILQRLSVLNDRIKLRQEQGLQVAANAVALRQGKGLMDQIWQKISEMHEAEKQLLQQRQQVAEARAKTSLAVIIGAGVVAFVVGVMAILIICRDLKLRERAETELEENQALLESILDNTPAIVFLKDLAGRYLFVNRRFMEVSGLSRDQIRGKTAFEIFQKEFAQVADEHYQTVISTGNPMEIEETVMYPDGPRKHLAVKYPLRDATGKIYAMAGISTDITARKQVEQMRLQFQSLFESAPGLYLVLKPDFTIVAASDAYLKATMTRRQEIMGKNLFEVFPDNPADATANGVSNLRASLDRVVKSAAPDTMAIQKYDVRRPDGTFEERYWSPVNSCVLNADGQVEYLLHRVEDVTGFVHKKQQAEAAGETGLNKRLEQMEAEVFRSSQEVQAANEQLRLANQELESFSYSVSHDLRAPVRHIDGFVKLLDKHAGEKLDAQAQRYLKIIANAARQMGMLIDDLLAFSRMGRMELRHSNVALDSLVHEAVDSLQMEMQGRQIKWKIGCLPEVKADPAMLRQVWTNLIANAIKYSQTRQPAEIEINCAPPANGEYVFFVRDNGVGFDMKYADKLFGIFQRLHSADEFEGTGIGLANVRRIVSRHGGRTWAEGKIDAGATFFFSLPKQQSPTQG